MEKIQLALYTFQTDRFHVFYVEVVVLYFKSNN